MCGIIGLISFDKITKSNAIAFENMFLKCEDRGRDAWGYFSYPKCFLHKQKGAISDYLKKKHLRNVLNQKIVLGHTRTTTTGTEQKHQNNHPFETRDFVMAHNGMIHNHGNFDFKTDIETDSVVIIKNIQDEFEKTKNVVKAIKETTKKLYGSYACWLLFKKTGTIYFFRHNNPIEIAYNKKDNFVVFASEEDMFEFLGERTVKKGFKDSLSIGEIEEDKVYRLTGKGLFDLGDFETKSYQEGGCAITYVNGDEIEKAISKKRNLDFETENELNDYMVTNYTISYYWIKDALREWGMYMGYSEKKIYISFDDQSYDDFKENFQKAGFTISPKTRTIVARRIDDLMLIYEIFEEMEEEYNLR